MAWAANKRSRPGWIWHVMSAEAPAPFKLYTSVASPPAPFKSYAPVAGSPVGSPEPTYTYETSQGTIVFKKLRSLFGSSVVMILPAHGDLNCPCEPCRASAYASRMEELGYTAVDIVKTVPETTLGSQS